MTTALLLAKATFLLAAALGVAYCCRHSARRVHQMWTVIFAMLMLLPLMAGTVPALHIPVTTTLIEPTPVVARSALDIPHSTAVLTADVVEPVSISSVPSAGRTNAPTTSRRWPDLQTSIVLVWLTGTAIALGMLASSLWRVRRLSQSAEEIRDRIWLEETAEITKCLGLRRDVRLLLSDRIDMPMAGETWRPTIFLPAEAVSWPAECRRGVLGHELAHLVRHDPRRHVAARVMLAIYWFHPLAWLATYLDARACEDACDEVVIRELGIRPSSYANLLLEFAGSTRGLFAAVALPMARHGSLERRLLRILHTPPRPRQAALPAPALFCGALAMIVGAAQPVARVMPLMPTPPRDVTPEVSPPISQSPAFSTEPSAHGVDLGGEAVRQRPGESGCRWSNRGMTTTEVVTAKGFTRTMTRNFGEISVCLVIENVPGSAMNLPSLMLAAGQRGILEARHAGGRQRLEMTPAAAALTPTMFVVNGIDRPIDAGVIQWQRQMLIVLDLTWQLAQLRGDVQTLFARIDATPNDGPNRARRAELERELRALNHEQRVTELETRRQHELAQLRRAVQTIGGPTQLAATPEPVNDSACALAAPPLLTAVGLSNAVAGRGRPRFLRETFGELQVCVRIDEGNVFETVRPSELLQRARYAVLEARRDGEIHQLVLAREASGIERTAWLVNGNARPIDTVVFTWKQSLLDLLDTSWRIWALRGQEGLLNGRIGLIHGRVSTNEIQPGEADASVAAIRSQIDALEVDQRIAGWTIDQESLVRRFRAAMSAVE